MEGKSPPFPSHTQRASDNKRASTQYGPAQRHAIKDETTGSSSTSPPVGAVPPALQHAGKDGYSQIRVPSTVSKRRFEACRTSVFDLMDEDYMFYNRSRPMEGGYKCCS